MSERFTGLPGKPAGGKPDLSPSLGGGVRPGRVMLLGCGVLLFLLAAAAILFLLKADDFVGWVFGSVEQTIVERLPPDLPGGERARLERAFADATAKIQSGEADPEALRRLQGGLSRAVRGGDRPLTREEVAEITVTLEAIAGTTPPDPDAPPVAIPGARSGPASSRP